MVLLVPAFAGDRVTPNLEVLVQMFPGLSSVTANWIIAKTWRSKQCQHVVNAERLDCKNRCLRCQSLDKNICPSKYPKLYNAVEKTTDRSMSQVVIECDDKVRERILFRLASLGDGADVTQDSELAMAAAQLRCAGCLVFDLHNKRSLVCCSGCKSFDIKDSRSNVSTQCNQCMHNVYNAKCQAKRQEDNKEERMDAQSRTPFSALSENKWKQCLSVLNTGRKVQSRKLQRALDKINKKEDEIRVSKEMHEHMKVAAEASVTEHK